MHGSREASGQAEDKGIISLALLPVPAPALNTWKTLSATSHRFPNNLLSQNKLPNKNVKI